MTRIPRRLHSVPTGSDVDPPSGPASTGPAAHTAPTAPSEVPGWPFPLVDLSSLTPNDVQVLMDRIGQFSQDGRFQTSEQRGPVPSRRRPRRAQPVTLRVRVDIDGIRPPIWRRVELASDLTLDQVHTILQSAFGWLDVHLHSFVCRDNKFDRHAERYLTEFDVSEGDVGVLESAVRLDELLVEPGDKIAYAYDFGDNWEHTLVLESVLPRHQGDPVARCTGGRRQGPPEDCGGVWAYQELLDLGEVRSDPEEFDLDGINADLEDLDLSDLDLGDLDLGDLDLGGPADSVNDARAAGGPGDRPPGTEMFAGFLPPGLSDLLSRSFGLPSSVLPDLLSRIDFAASISLPQSAAEQLAARFTWLLDRVGDDGLALTSAGYLKPADVSAAFTELDLAGEWTGAGTREAHTPAVRQLRESAQRLGLLRKSNGLLLPTKAGLSVRGHPHALLDWIASRLPLGRTPLEKDAGLALLTVVAAGGPLKGAATATAEGSIDQLVADVMSGVGWQGSDGRPIAEHEASITADLTDIVLQQLSALEMLPRFGGWRVTPEGAEFARFTLTRGGRA